MSHKINLGRVFKRHYSSWKDDGKNSYSIFDLFTFIALPLITGVISFFMEFRFEDFDDLTKSIITSFAILIGLLFSSLVMILNTIKMSNWSQSNLDLFQEIIANISYCITIIIITALLLLVQFITPDKYSIFDLIFDSFIVSFLAHILLTFLMVLKRTFEVAYSVTKV